MKLRENNLIDHEIKEFEKGLLIEKMEDKTIKIEDRDYEDYKLRIEVWKERGWIFDDQPPRFEGYFSYSKERCIKERQACKFQFECDDYSNKDCNQETCHNYETKF